VGGNFHGNFHDSAVPGAASAAPVAGATATQEEHTVRNVFIVLAVLFVLGIGGCVAFLGAVGTEVANEANRQDERNAPRAVTVGKAFDNRQAPDARRVGREERQRDVQRDGEGEEH